MNSSSKGPQVELLLQLELFRSILLVVFAQTVLKSLFIILITSLLFIQKHVNEFLSTAIVKKKQKKQNKKRAT